jgi:hypothetical protein
MGTIGQSERDGANDQVICAVVRQAAVERVAEKRSRAVSAARKSVSVLPGTRALSTPTGRDSAYDVRDGEILARLLYEGCHRGHYPLDERLGLRPNQMSAELERLAGMVGVQTAFGKGSQLFEELTLISLSDHSLDKSAQSYGQTVDQVEQQWQAEAADQAAQLKRQREARPVLRLYGALDGALMHIRGDEDNPWRELKIGAWFQAKGHPPKRPMENGVFRPKTSPTTPMSVRHKRLEICCGPAACSAMLTRWWN